MILHDISPLFRRDMQCWPGDMPFGVERVARIEDGSTVNVSSVVISSQVGSHADAPLHYRADGASIAELVLEPFIGPCHLVDARSSVGATIGFEILPQLPEQVERLLIRQYDRQPDRWDPHLKGIDPALVVELARRGARLIGMDAASVDPADSKTLAAHHALDAHDIRIIEGLLLDDVAAGEYELVALPLKLADCDGAPLRAILRSPWWRSHRPERA